MTETAISSYRRLFEVRLLHHYWLDEGAVVYDLIPDAAKRQGRLLDYDMRPFLAVAPTPATQDLLRGYRCLFRETALGFVVGAPSDAVLPIDTTFDFAVTAGGSDFGNYTALTLRRQKIYEIADPTDNSETRVTYRYKENVPLLSNLTGTTRGAGPGLQLFLSREIPAPDAGDPVEALVLSAGALNQLTSDNPAATTQQLAAVATALPVFVHQADAPAIVPPAGVAGAPARGISLSADVPDAIFALISLTAIRPGNDAFSFTDAMGAPKPAPPIYQVRFKNRSTVWTYLDKSTGAVTATEPGPLPLTFFGNAGSKQKPPRAPVKAELSGTKINRLISEVYV